MNIACTLHYVIFISGCMYSMVAFGLVCGFLLGGYLLSYHENYFLYNTVPENLYPGHSKWIGAWWAGFVICGILLLLVSHFICMFIFLLNQIDYQSGSKYNSIYSS